MEENNENKTEEVKEITENVDIKTETETVSENNKTTKDEKFEKEKTIFKDFVKNFFRTPYIKTQEIISNYKSYLTIAISILIIWVVAGLIDGMITVANRYSITSYLSFEGFIRISMTSLSTILTSALIPIIIVALLSAIIYLFMKNKNKNFFTIVTAVAIAKTPVAVASIISLFSSVSSEVAKMTNEFSGFCFVLSTVLLYFAIKALYKENDDDKAIIKFILIMAVYYVVSLILSFFKLYI